MLTKRDFPVIPLLSGKRSVLLSPACRFILRPGAHLFQQYFHFPLVVDLHLLLQNQVIRLPIMGVVLNCAVGLVGRIVLVPLACNRLEVLLLVDKAQKWAVLIDGTGSGRCTRIASARRGRWRW